jgi:hypothetical protein
MWRAMEAKATTVVGLLAGAQETRLQWEALTEPARRVALAADLELRRRHPGHRIEPLKSAEPQGTIRPDPSRAARRQVWVQETLDGSLHLPQQATEQAAGQETPPAPEWQGEVAGQQALGLTPETAHDDIPEQVLRIRENACKTQAAIDELRGAPVPAEDQDATDLGPAWGLQARRDREAILQPPKPQVAPAGEILRRAQERQADYQPEPA